jgi:D-alanyl-D-alanine carboxypeptidase/D-alanyl-D-alanine-endopeptidase (penicillin-binding protein 4)
MRPGRRRRIPSLLSSLLLGLLPALPAAAELPERVLQIARALDVPAEDISVWVQPADSDEPLLTHLPDRPRSPASTMKLLTTFAALQGLTPAFRWETEVHALGPVEKGVLKGDLLLRGYGDPYLVTEEYWKLINGVRQAGIRRIEGDLVFDTSHFELPDEDPADFDGRPDRVYNMTPHPLLVNFNAVRFRFMPDPDGGVEVMTEPELPNVAIDNRLGLARHGCYGYQRGVALNVVDAESERDRVMLEGRFPTGCAHYGMTRTVLRPESYAFGLFDVYWRQLGGELTGGWRLGTVPGDLLSIDPETGAPLPIASESLIHVHRSRPLGDIVRLVNKYSNNVMTRHLQLTLGADRFGPPATEPKGNRAIREILEQQGVPLEGLLIDNPSGLSRTARLSARQLGTLLAAAWEGPYMPEFVSSLALSGLDGTLRHRLGEGPERGRMHLKTGTMDEVSAIAGYVQAIDGDRHVVVILINSPLADRGPGEEIQDALLRWVLEL